MSKGTDRVCEAWVRGGNAAAGAMITADGRLFSYNLVIGDTNEQGETIAINYTAQGGGDFVSVTTSRHAVAAMSCADRVVNPSATSRKGESR